MCDEIPMSPASRCLNMSQIHCNIHTGTNLYSRRSVFLQSAWPPAGQGSNKLLIQAEICLDIPPPQGAKRPGGAAEGGARGISKQISAWISRLLLPWPARRPSRLQDRTWPRLYFGASIIVDRMQGPAPALLGPAPARPRPGRAGRGGDHFESNAGGPGGAASPPTDTKV